MFTNLIKHAVGVKLIILLAFVLGYAQTPLPDIEVTSISEIKYNSLVYLDINNLSVKDAVSREIFIDKNGLLATVTKIEGSEFAIAFLSNPITKDNGNQISVSSISSDPKGQMIAYRRRGSQIRIVWVDYQRNQPGAAVHDLINAIVEERKRNQYPIYDYPFVSPLMNKIPNSSIVPPVITHKEPAIYQEEAIANEIRGVVLLSVVFTAEGRVGGIRVLRGLPYGLTARAIEAATKIKYKPATKGGAAISVRAQLEYEFKK